MGVGLRIKEIARENKMTIKQLSEKSGVSLNTMYSITKRDSDRIDSVILRKISDALNVSCLHISNGIKISAEKGEITKCEECTHHNTYDCPAYDFQLGITSQKMKYCSYGAKMGAE